MKNTNNIFAPAKLGFLCLILSIVSCTGATSELKTAEKLVKNKPDSALVVLQSSNTSESANKNIRATHYLLDSWARYNSYRKDYKLEDLKFATDYFLKGANRTRKAQSYYVRGCVFMDMNIGSPADWVEDFLRGCKEVEKTKEYELAALLHLRYAASIAERQWYDESNSYYLKAVEFAQKAGVSGHHVSALINLSHNCLFQGDKNKDYSEAVKWGKEACEVAESSGNNDMYSRALYSLSSCYSRSGQHRQALDCALKSVRIQENLHKEGKRKDRVRYVAVADAYRKMGNADSTLFYAMKDYDHPSIVSRMSATQLLYITYRDLLGDDKMSVKYLTEYQQLKSEYNSKQETDKISQSHIDIEKEESAKTTSSVIVTSLAAILTMGFFILYIVRALRIRLKRKDRDIREIKKDLADKEHDIQQIEKDLADKEHEAERVTAVLIDKDELVMSLREKPHYLQDKDWEKLTNTIDKVYGGFCKDLSNAGLTQGNIRLACLMKLGISTSDAAIILGISPSSVTKAKQRLKGKIQLPMSR